MKTLTRSPQAAAAILGTFVAASTVHAADVIEGRLIQATNTAVILEVSEAEQSFKFDPIAAQCFDFRNDRMTCDTLVAIGYADKVRLTVANGLVQRIDILKLQQ